MICKYSLSVISLTFLMSPLMWGIQVLMWFGLSVWGLSLSPPLQSFQSFHFHCQIQSQEPFLLFSALSPVVSVFASGSFIHLKLSMWCEVGIRQHSSANRCLGFCSMNWSTVSGHVCTCKPSPVRHTRLVFLSPSCYVIALPSHLSSTFLIFHMGCHGSCPVLDPLYSFILLYFYLLVDSLSGRGFLDIPTPPCLCGMAQTSLLSQAFSLLVLSHLWHHFWAL